MRRTEQGKRATDSQLRQMVGYNFEPLKELRRELGLTSAQVSDIMSDADMVAQMRLMQKAVYRQVVESYLGMQKSHRMWVATCKIKLGLCADAYAMKCAIEANRVNIEGTASRLLAAIEYAKFVAETELVFVTAETVGLYEEWFSLKQLVDAAFAAGLKFCEPEDGPQLAAQYSPHLHQSVKVVRPIRWGNWGSAMLLWELRKDYTGTHLEMVPGRMVDTFPDSDVFAFRIA